MRATVHEIDLPGRMTPSDALFWYAESALPNLRPLIGGLYVLDRTPDRAGLEAALEVAMRAVPRLRQRVVEVPFDLGLPEWIEDEHFDRDYHVRHISLPAGGGQRELLDLCGRLFSAPLDRERPLWDATLIDGIEGGRAALLMRMHHAVVDGVGSIAILNAMTGLERDAPLPHVVRHRRRRRRPQETTVGIGALAHLAVDNVTAVGRTLTRAATIPLQLAADPDATLEQIRRALRGLKGVVADAAHPLIPDPLLRGSTSGLSRRFDVMQVPIERLRRIKEPLGATLNDVVLAALAGCVHDYHRRRRVRTEVLNCMVPMSLRGGEDRDGLGNRVGMFSILLPVGEKDPAKRLEAIVAQTHRAKSDKRSAAYPMLMQLLAVVPGVAFRYLARQALGRVNLVCTNVPGVAERRYVGGAAIEALYPLVAIVEGTPLVMALLSYAGEMNVGIDTDPEAIPDPHRLGEMFAHALDELEALAEARRAAAG